MTYQERWDSMVRIYDAYGMLVPSPVDNDEADWMFNSNPSAITYIKTESFLDEEMIEELEILLGYTDFPVGATMVYNTNECEWITASEWRNYLKYEMSIIDEIEGK